MRSVNVAELKNRLSKYLTFARSGEEVVIRDRNLPVAKLVPANEDGDEIFGALAGIARITGDIENTVPTSEWEVE